MNDDLSLLASAYLDDEVTADERALIEADADVMAEVDRMRAVRALLADVEPPAISMREAHLAAALSAWDRLPDAERTGSLRDVTPPGADRAAVAGAASVSAPTRLSDRRAARANRRMLGAAAALVVVLGGGIALQVATGGGNDSDDSASFEAGALTAADDAGGTADDATDAARNAATPAPAVASEALEVADADDAGPADTLDTGTGVGGGAPPAEADTVILFDTTDLADFASAAMNAPDSEPTGGGDSTDEADADTAATGEATEQEAPLYCFDVDLIAGFAQFVDQPVIVGVVTSRNLVIAYQVDRCIEVARVRVP